MKSIERIEKAKLIFKEMETPLSNLWCRWQDEKEYEDWNEYASVMKQRIEKQGGDFIKAYKRPFGLTYELGGFKYQIKMNAKSYSFKRV